MTPRETLENWQRAGRKVVHEADAKDLLQRIGVPVPQRDPAHGRCVAKLCHDDYPHKSDHGLVRLGLSPDEAKQAAAEMAERFAGGTALIEEMDPYDDARIAFERAIFGAARPLAFDANGRVTLPKEFAEHAGLDAKATMRHVQWPLALMGHIWEKPDGPDGLPEADNAWITPQGVSARLQWALAVPQMLLRDLPDPRDFVVTALGPDAPPNVRFAAEAAESRSDGVGLVLASPAFQRV